MGLGASGPPAVGPSQPDVCLLGRRTSSDTPPFRRERSSEVVEEPPENGPWFAPSSKILPAVTEKESSSPSPLQSSLSGRSCDLDHFVGSRTDYLWTGSGRRSDAAGRAGVPKASATCVATLIPELVSHTSTG